MKIQGVTIAGLGEAGNVVTVAFQWQPNEAFDLNDVGSVLAWLQLHGLCGDGCMAQHTVTAEEKAMLLAPTLTDDVESRVAAAEITNEDADALIAAAVAPATRRRKFNPLEVADAGAAPLPEATGEPTSRRRRAEASPAPAAAEDGPRGTPSAPTAETTSPSEAEAAPLRRRRAAPAAEGTPATTAPTEVTAASPEPSTRRRRAAPSAEPEPVAAAPVTETAPTPPASEPAAPSITDADMSKAASRAAAVLTPNVVKAFVATFLKDDDTPCTSVNQIHADDRRDFLDELQAKIEAAQ